MDDLLRRNRKYTVWWAAFLMSSMAMFLGRMTDELWVEFNIYAFGLYMLGNVGEHATKKLGKQNVEADS